MLLVGLAGTGLAFGDESVFSLWLLSGDLLYCIIFPQLICVLHISCSNSYGAISGYGVGLLLRVMSGEQVLGIPPLLLYPGWKEEDGVITQYFPYRTLAMLCSVICIVVVSKLVELVFCRQLIPQSWDLLGVFEEKTVTWGGGGTRLYLWYKILDLNINLSTVSSAQTIYAHFYLYCILRLILKHWQYSEAIYEDHNILILMSELTWFRSS